MSSPGDAGGPAGEAFAFRLCLEKPDRMSRAAALVFVAAAIWVLLVDADDALLAIGVALVLFAVFYGLGQRRRARAEADRAAKIVVDRHGLALPELFPEPLPWAAIEKLRIERKRYGAHLRLKVDDARARGYAPRGLARLPWSLGVATINVDIAPLEGEDDELAAAIRRFAPRGLLGGT